MDLNDEELSEVHSIVYDYCYYGDNEVVYGEEGDVARVALGKILDECKRRGFQWAR